LALQPIKILGRALRIPWTSASQEYVGEDGARWRLGNIYELQDRKEEARKQYEIALSVNPQNENVRKSLKEWSEVVKTGTVGLCQWIIS
jgi:tetratricopeptide (TPR) repeat protein